MPLRGLGRRLAPVEWSYYDVLVCSALTEGHQWGCGCCASSEEQIPSTAPKSSYETKDDLQMCREIKTSHGLVRWAAVAVNDTLCQQTWAVLARLVVLCDGNGSGRAANTLVLLLFRYLTFDIILIMKK